jgi:hypothetical protein
MVVGEESIGIRTASSEHHDASLRHPSVRPRTIRTKTSSTYSKNNKLKRSEERGIANGACTNVYVCCVATSLIPCIAISHRWGVSFVT